MRRVGWNKQIGFAIVCLSVALAGCGKQDDANGTGNQPPDSNRQQPAEAKPVTLKVMKTSSVSITDEDFRLLFEEPVKKKYPHITLEFIKNAKDADIKELVAAGNTPDIVALWNGHMPEVRDLDIFQDITPLLKKANVDLARFEPEYLDAIRIVSDKKELYGLPYAVQFNALFYNKNIFDKFGVSYPKDGMTWEDAIELAKRVTRKDGETQIRGLDPNHLERLSFPLSLTMVDPVTNKATVNNDQWRKVFDIAYQIYSIPGNANNGKAFQHQVIAMFGGYNIFNSLIEESKKGFTGWDVAQYPSYKDKPNTYGLIDAHVLTISKTTKHAEDAMKVLEVVTSDEVQTISAKKTLRLTPLKNADIKKALGSDDPFLKEKRIESIFKSKPSHAVIFSKHHAAARNEMNQSFKEHQEGKDVNTALREAEERINKLAVTK